MCSSVSLLVFVIPLTYYLVFFRWGGYQDQDEDIGICLFVFVLPLTCSLGFSFRYERREGQEKEVRAVSVLVSIIHQIYHFFVAVSYRTTQQGQHGLAWST